MLKGTLYLLPVPLSENSERRVVPPLHTDLINRINHYIVENEKTARRWLKVMGLKTPQSDLLISVYGKHSDKQSADLYFNPLEQGNDVALMSEAGCPAIADPGSAIVAEAHRRRIMVCPLTGPSAILLALMASGFNGQNFAFNGYLPIDKEARSRRIKELEALLHRSGQTQIFIETPFRNNTLTGDIVKSCNPTTVLCIAVNLTGEDEQVIVLPIQGWKTRSFDFHKMPAIFILGKSG